MESKQGEINMACSEKPLHDPHFKPWASLAEFIWPRFLLSPHPLHSCWLISRGSSRINPSTHPSFSISSHRIIQSGFTADKAKMACSAEVLDQPCHVRSISLPSSSHPLTLRVEGELNSLRTSVASSPLAPQEMSNGLRRLGDLYDCIEEFLRLPRSQQAFHHPHQKKWLEDELDESVKVLDLCSTLREKLVTMKKHVQGLRLALRRRDTSMESKLHAYICFGKMAQKDVEHCFRSLKQMHNKSLSCSAVEKDSDSSMAAQLLMGAREIAIFLLQSILLFFSISRPKTKASNWSFVSKALQKRKVACENREVSWYVSYDCIFCKDADDEKVLKAQDQLEMLKDKVEDLETELECLYRGLIQNRVSLLNILSL